MTKLLNQKKAARLLSDHGWSETRQAQRKDDKRRSPAYYLAETQGSGLQSKSDSLDIESSRYRSRRGMSARQETYNALVTHEDDGSYWAQVQELPGCFASGETLDELMEALQEAISLYLADDADALEITSAEIEGKPMQLDSLRVRVPA